LRVGLFATPGTWRCWVRASNGSGGRRSDAVPDVRGLAVKVLGVPGDKLIPALIDAKTQDFLTIANEVTPFRTAEEFVTVIEAGAGSALGLVFRLLWRLGPSRAVTLLRDLQRELGVELAHWLDRPYYSALPIRWGEQAVKYAWFPVRVPDAQAPMDRARPDHYGPDLAGRLRAGDLVLALKVQRFVDEASTPIEDPTVRWTSPWEQVATLTLPRQDLDDDRGRRLAALVEQLSFDPWHAPTAFRPLGQLMRARNVAYRESGIARAARGEPDGTEVEGPT
ncbi:MAG: hypothetical protein KC621_20495, partial [Myxococcales bacterium]|nr:hypothetical protein [Myxococcales bacterium]